MIVKFFELKNKNIKNNKFFLLYGNNKGLIEETIEKNLKPISSNRNIFNYDESELIKNLDNLEEEISNKSFFDKEKLIIIRRASDKLCKFIEDVIERNLTDILFILISANLEKKSKLRNFFEKSKDTVCVPFYEDNLKTLSLLAFNFFKEKKISLSQQNINLLVERSRGDRINLYNELDKIENFLKNKKQIKIEEILKLTNLSENYDFSELVDHSLAKNKKKNT